MRSVVRKACVRTCEIVGGKGGCVVEVGMRREGVKRRK